MKVKLEKYAFPIERAHKSDAGLDLRSPGNYCVPARGSISIQTGVHVLLPAGTAGLLVSKSGLNVNHDITSTGLIDEGYTGEIIVKLANGSDMDYFIKVGDKISQLVVLPVVNESVEIVDKFDVETERGEKGFGSSGR